MEKRESQVIRQVYNDPPEGQDLHVLFCGDQRCTPRHSFHGRRDHWVIHYIVSGEGSVWLNNVRHDLAAGSSFVIFPEQANRYQSSATHPWHYRWIGFSGTRVDEMLSQARITRASPFVSHDYKTHVDSYFQTMYRVMLERDEGFLLHTLSLLYQLLREIQIINRDAPVLRARHVDYVETAQRFIANHFRTNFSVQELARILGIHRSYLSQVFKQRTGNTIQEFIIQYRIERAKESLLHTEDSIQSIAQSCGYYNYPAFEKRFRHVTGYSPTEYRKQFFIEPAQFYPDEDFSNITI